MEFKNEIAEFVSGKKDGITIIDLETGIIVYADNFYQKLYGEVEGKNAEETYPWLGDAPAFDADAEEEKTVQEWEIIDSGKYFLVHSSPFHKDGKAYVMHQLTDISVYMTLNRDMTKYMSFFKKLSGFQTAVIEKMQSTYYELLPMLSDFFKSDRVYLMLQRDEQLDIVTYIKNGNSFDSVRVPYAEQLLSLSGTEDLKADGILEDMKAVFSAETAEGAKGFIRLCNGEISGEKYAIYMSVGAKTDVSTTKEETIVNVIRIPVEISIMREQLIYNSEHDMLTGLYNKGKYLSMLENEYENLDSIGLFNMDVNNLKKMNDTYGHEAGDKLLIKAADSIRKVTNNKVHGYRMGGDEYLMVACNMTKEEVDVIKDRWEAELARLNTIDDGINCVIAVGLVYAQKPYDFSKIAKEADELMYEDKKRKKKPGEEIR